MIFSSLVFLCVFLPVTYILSLLLPSVKMKNFLLLVVSLIFYAYGEPIYVILMIVCTAINYVCAYKIETATNKKILVAVDVVLNIGMLVVFKYAAFILESINMFANTNIKVPSITLPIGISFFTFQALSYVIDVYSGTVKVQKNFFNVMLYISFFPQLIAGPIVKYRDIELEIENRHQSVSEMAEGLRRFICGLAKKVIVANSMGLVADNIFGLNISEINTIAGWLGAIAYMFQIYYDFSGYSDMAIGLGKMFGFHFNENFMYPYGAVSMKDFWRRWHISLSTWFKEYVYIPLGGNRKGKVRTCINRIIVFFLTGLWHGANWTFVVWGLYNGFFLLLEEFVPFVRKLPQFITRIYTVIVVCVGFVIFRADSISQACLIIKNMFVGNLNESPVVWQQLTPWFCFCFVIALVGVAPIRYIADKIRKNIYESEVVVGIWKYVDSILYFFAFILLGWCIIRLSGGTYNPFIYFRF